MTLVEIIYVNKGMVLISSLSLFRALQVLTCPKKDFNLPTPALEHAYPFCRDYMYFSPHTLVLCLHSK